MPTEHPVDRAQEYWLAQPTETFRLGAGDLARKIKRLETDARNNNVAMYVAMLFNGVMWAAMTFIVDGAVTRAGAVVALLGWGFAIGQVTREWRRTIAACLDMAEMPVASFYRAALERERSLFVGGRFWTRYVAMIAGPVLFAVGIALEDPGAAIVAFIIGATFVGLSSLSIPGRHKMLRDYQRKMDELEMLGSSARVKGEG